MLQLFIGNMVHTYTFLWAFFIVVIRANSTQTQQPIVNTRLGSVMGEHRKSYEGRTYTAFEGIPYAKPPVGQLRFKEPQPADPWSNTLTANKTYVCMQYTAIFLAKSVLGDEDCLYLNIYVPRETINSTEKLNVVVHIHGGAFIVGDPASMSGPEYIMDRDLIYVSMNYRLGILGFLSTEDEVVPGNNGLKDQVLAMRWVKENIDSFGGYPDSVTLVGASSGAACVHFHYLSPLSKGLFHRGFSQSGVAISPWSLTRNPVRNAKKLGHLLGCSWNSSKELVDCLRQAPVSEVSSAHANFLFFANSVPITTFGPVVEYAPDAFLPDEPYRLLAEGKFNDYPWITSNVRDEGIVPVQFFILHQQLQEFEARWNELAPHALGYNDTANDKDKVVISEKIRDHYLKNKAVAADNLHDLVRLFSDRLFLVDAVRAARLQAKVSKSPIYYYLFDYVTSKSLVLTAGHPVISHGDDTRLLYSQLGGLPLSKPDHEMKNIFINFLYSFASKGTPVVSGVEWKPVSSYGDINYLHITSPHQIRMTSTKDIGNAAFWDSLPLKEHDRLLKFKRIL